MVGAGAGEPSEDGARTGREGGEAAPGEEACGMVCGGTECWGADGACPSVDNWGYVYGRNGSGNVIR